VLELLILVYALAVGFAAAGLSSSIYEMVTLQPASFIVQGTGIPLLIVTGFFFAVTGPMLVFRKVMAGRKEKRLTVGITVSGLALCAMWSCCVGLLLIEAMLHISDSV
jgi:hypothetical protein